jgi:anthranilate phosphoribosyltransferase
VAVAKLRQSRGLEPHRQRRRARVSSACASILTPESACRSLDALGITFLFAPNYHTALRHAAAARREIGVRTVFNVLGPLTNPAGAKRQLLGVYDDSLVVRVAEVLRELGSERAWVVHGRDGLDELTLFAKSHVAELDGGKIREFEIDPGELGLAHTDRTGVEGATPRRTRRRSARCWRGEKGPRARHRGAEQRRGLVVAGVAPDLRDGDRARLRGDRQRRAREKLAALAAFRAEAAMAATD